MPRHFDPYARHYASLSVKDLLDARDMSHVQFSHSTNVFATAIGLYRIRNEDNDAKKYVSAGHAAKHRGHLGARTLENSVVRAWSWPCVLVFVREWLTSDQLRKHPDRAVPSFLYLSDGRVVPVCTVQASLREMPAKAVTGPLTFSSHLIGGGYPVSADVQGQEHTGTVGCLVTDGDRYFALTNHHIAGSEGREIKAEIKGERVRVGVAAGASRRDVNFTDVYPEFAGTKTRANIDAGLIDIDDVSMWTSQVFGLGVLGEAVHFDGASASLDWIGIPVLAHGARSGRLEGEIKALFYRYRTLNGTDYVSDFLIGGRDKHLLNTAPGNSGMLWCLDPVATVETDDRAKKTTKKAKAKDASAKGSDMPERYRPLAIEWGGQKLSSDKGAGYAQYALAASVAVACDQLDVEIVTDIDAEHTQYWGAVGHYKIAQLATTHVATADLKSFLAANLRLISYDDEAILHNQFAKDATHFIPLADVPDIVWKTNINRGGKAARAQENWNHYADLDLPDQTGKTLSDLCGSDPKLRLKAWIDFYKRAPAPAKAKSNTNNMGALPFRVWQIFDAMAGFRAAGDANRFLCAAGVLSHYVGDACQPLHGSMHADGLNGASTGVHSVYEEKMVDRFAPDIGTALDQFDFDLLGPKLALVKTGHDAGAAVVNLMRRTSRRLPPETICNAYTDLGGGSGAAVVKGLWTQCGKDTVACIADGTRTLAMLWDSAYRAAGKKKFSGAKSSVGLKKIYENKKFLESLHMAHLKPANYPAPS